MAAGKVFDILRSRILVVDEQPTLTRMFARHRQAPSNSATGESRKRVHRVLVFYDDAATSQYLRRTVISLQLLAQIQHICAQ